MINRGRGIWARKEWPDLQYVSQGTKDYVSMKHFLLLLVLSMYHTWEMPRQPVLMCFKYFCFTVLNTLSFPLRSTWNWVLRKYHISYIIILNCPLKIPTLFLNVTIQVNLNFSIFGDCNGAESSPFEHKFALSEIVKWHSESRMARYKLHEGRGLIPLTGSPSLDAWHIVGIQ